MSVRDTVLAAVRAWAERLEMAPEVPEQLLDAHRAEVLREEATRLRRVEREMPQGAHGARMGVLKAALVLDEDADLIGEKASATAREPICRCGHAERSHRRLTTWGGTGCLACTGPIGRAWLHDFTAEEKTTAAAAAVTPQPATGWHAARDLTGRLGPLLAHIRARPDHTWIPSDVHRLDLPEAKEPCTCSRDLEALATLGWLVERQEPGRRVFVYNFRKDGSR